MYKSKYSDGDYSVTSNEHTSIFDSVSVTKPANIDSKQDAYIPSAANIWLDIALQATAREHTRNRPRSTIGSRILAIAMTSMYDAWAMYDSLAKATRLTEEMRRPVNEHTLTNKAKAIGYAIYRALLFVVPEDREWLVEQMHKQGLDPNDNSTDMKRPQGVGNIAANAIIQHYSHDGANQLGDEVGSNGLPYSDYTFYRPINSVNKSIDPNSWQPIEFQDPDNSTFIPGFITPHWYRVKPFALQRSNQFRPGPPPKIGIPQLQQEVEEVISYNANLTLTQKAIIEYMRDGPNSTGQAGQWLGLAQMISKRDKNSLDRDVKLYFSVAMTAFDAFIAAWDAKRVYDSSRPWTLVRHYYAGRTLKGWAGPGKGVTTLQAESWHPYSPFLFITPPFPGYLSGHSAVSAACARVLALFTGSDYFGQKEIVVAGSLTEPGYDCRTIQMYDGRIPENAEQSCNITLTFPTLSGVAELAGLSRIMGGYHIQTDNIEGLKLGRLVGDYVWPKLKGYFKETGSNAISSSTQLLFNNLLIALLSMFVFLFVCDF